MDFKIVILLITFFCTGCNLYMDEEPDYLYISNNCDYDIHVITTISKTDTILPFIFESGIHRRSIPSNRTENLFIELDTLSQTDSISFFFLKKDDVYNYSWNDITNQRLILNIYILSKNDISIITSKSNYPKAIPFPPSDVMKNMRIIKLYYE